MVDSDISILKRMIQPTGIVPLEFEYQKNIVKLTEVFDNYTVTIAILNRSQQI